MRLRWTVYEEWGFDRLAHLGRGITALFAGPSGTGKTMAAQVLARALGLELYRVDLAGVVNKYIGETEKRLREVFDACERADVLLFFDEADALFGSARRSRTRTTASPTSRSTTCCSAWSSSTASPSSPPTARTTSTRPSCGGCASSSTSSRRGPAERLALWRRALLPNAPAGDALLDDDRLELLAERLQLTGADIKAAALAAAFLARAEGERIGMRHVLAAAQREMAKHGAALRVRLQEAR